MRPLILAAGGMLLLSSAAHAELGYPSVERVVEQVQRSLSAAVAEASRTSLPSLQSVQLNLRTARFDDGMEPAGAEFVVIGEGGPQPEPRTQALRVRLAAKEEGQARLQPGTPDSLATAIVEAAATLKRARTSPGAMSVDRFQVELPFVVRGAADSALELTPVSLQSTAEIKRSELQNLVLVFGKAE